MMNQKDLFDDNIVCTYLFLISKYGYPPDARNTLHHIDEIRALGFKSLELEGIRQEHLLGMYDLREQIVQKITENNLSVPYFCVVLPGLSAEDANERKRNLSLFEKGCEIATGLNSKGVLDNAPLPPYHFPKEIPVVRHYDEDVLQMATINPEINWSGYWEEMVNTYRTACDIAADKNLTYHMHPCMGAMAANSEAFLYFYDAVGRDNLRFNLDTANQFYLKENLNLALRRLSSFIDYIHLSDNGGKRVEHLKPEDGKINWKDFFGVLKDIGFSGHIGLDIGGDESEVRDIDEAYIEAARWVDTNWK
jgi:sugar phosphate isomerase/epimerase